MKKSIIKFLILLTLSLSLVGCKRREVSKTSAPMNYGTLQRKFAEEKNITVDEIVQIANGLPNYSEINFIRIDGKEGFKICYGQKENDYRNWLDNHSGYEVIVIYNNGNVEISYQK